MAPSRWCLQEEGDKVNLLLPSPHQQPGAMLGSQLAFTPHIHLPRWVRLQPSFPDDTPKSESKRQGRDQSPGRLAPASAPGALAEDARVPLSLPSLTEQVSFNKLGPLPFLVWVGKTLGGGLQAKAGPKPKQSTRDYVTKEEEGIHSCSSRCNELNLCN